MPKKRKVSLLEHFSFRMIKWIGTPNSILVHTVGFLAAFALIPFFGHNDVLNVLTNLVSLEAIYLALFIQMTVNRQHHRIKGIEEDIDEILEDTESLTEEEAG